MVKKECINCTKSSYRGKDANNNLHFGCNAPYCTKEEIVPNKYHDEIIQELQNGSKNSRR